MYRCVFAMITRYPVVAVVGATLCLILGLRPSDAFIRAGFFTTHGHPASRARANHAMMAAATLSSDEAFTKLGNLLKDAQSTPNLQEGSISVSSRNADQRLVNFLDELKAEKLLTSWNSTRLSPYRVTKTDVRIYTRMQEDIATTLGFTSSPVLERIEGGMAIVMAFTILTSVLALDKFPGPDIVRWFATAFLVSTPFFYISIGLSFPESLIRGVNEVLFSVNKGYKERLYRHEAGHFLVGYLCGLPVLNYDVGARLSAVQFAKVLAKDEGVPLLGPLPQDMLTPEPQDSKIFQDDEMSKLIVLSLAGVISEYIRFGQAEGGYQDIMQLQVMMDLQNPLMSEREAEEQVNWGALMAYSILKNNEEALSALVAAFERKASVVECIQILEAKAVV